MFDDAPTVARPRLVERAPKSSPAMRLCRWCGQKKAITKSSHLRAHRCAHGRWCVPPYEERRRGVKGHTCLECFDGRQLALFEGT